VWGPNEMPERYDVASEIGELTYKVATNGDASGELTHKAEALAEKMVKMAGGGGQAPGGHFSKIFGMRKVPIRYRRRQTGESADGVGGNYVCSMVQSNDPDTGSEAWLGRVKMQLAREQEWPLEETLLELIDVNDSDDDVALGDELNFNDRADVERWHRFHQTEGRVQRIPHNALQQLMARSRAWDSDMPAVCVRNDVLSTHWAKIKREVFPRMAQGGWNVADALTRIRDGEREVEVLFGILDGHDEANRAVVEHVLCSVKVLESADSKTIFPRLRDVNAMLMQPWSEEVSDYFPVIKSSHLCKQITLVSPTSLHTPSVTNATPIKLPRRSWPLLWRANMATLS
jgi:hypothetical protein